MNGYRYPRHEFKLEGIELLNKVLERREMYKIKWKLTASLSIIYKGGFRDGYT